MIQADFPDMEVSLLTRRLPSLCARHHPCYTVCLRGPSAFHPGLQRSNQLGILSEIAHWAKWDSRRFSWLHAVFSCHGQFQRDVGRYGAPQRVSPDDYLAVSCESTGLLRDPCLVREQRLSAQFIALVDSDKRYEDLGAVDSACSGSVYGLRIIYRCLAADPKEILGRWWK